MLNSQSVSTNKDSFVYCALLFLSLFALANMFTLQDWRSNESVAMKDDSVFSAERALESLQHIAAEPHPVGSEAHKKVREYLVAELKALGLNTEVQSGKVYTTDHGIDAAGLVHNVVARLPGTSGQGKALLLAAHYDSVPTSPGASDNGASVAAVLESIRAIQHNGPLTNDVIVLFSDAEEVALLGAHYFVDQHRWANDVGLVLNFEYRGNSGPVLMFETSEGYSNLISSYADSVATPSTNSLLYEVYRLLPNDTDMTVFKSVDYAGMNFVSIEQAHHYHSEIDTVENLDKATLQTQGETMLSLIQQFGHQDLSQLKGENNVFFTLPKAGVIQYSMTWAYVLFAVLAVIFVVTLLVTVKSDKVQLPRVFKTTFAILGAIFLIAICSQLLWEVVSLVNPEYYLLMYPYNSEWYLLAFIFLSIASYVYIEAKWLTGYSILERVLGSSVLWLFLLGVTLLTLPGASFLFTWPLLGTLIYAVYYHFVKPEKNSWRHGIATLISLLPLLVIFTPVIQLLFLSVGPQLPFVTVMFVVLAMSSATSWISNTQHKWVNPIGPAMIGSLFIGAGFATNHYDESHPIPTNLFYVYNGSTDKAYWISRSHELDSWTKTVFDRKQPPIVQEDIFGPDSPPYWAKNIDKIAGIDAPEIELVSRQVVDGKRQFTFKVRSQQNSQNLAVRVDHAQVLSSRVEGVPLTADHEGYWRLNAYAMGQDWLTVQVTLEGEDPFTLRVYDEVFELPQNHGLIERPEDLTASIYGSSNSTRTVITKEYQ